MVLFLVAVDLGAALYLLWYGLRREVRRRPAVLAVGALLVLVAASLAYLYLGALSVREPPPLPVPSPLV